MSNNVFTSKVYNKQKFTIPKNSVYQIQFNGNNPNYYRVNNLGETVLYFATNNTPREDLYDFKCSPNSVANFAEPYTRDFLYCYNPNNVDVDILVTYWEGEFDPAFIAFGESTLSVEGTIKTDGVINAFNTSLPKGTNTIGDVGLEANTLGYIQNMAVDTNGISTKSSDIRQYVKNINTDTNTMSPLIGNIATSGANTNALVRNIGDKIDTLNNYMSAIYERYVGGLYYNRTLNVTNTGSDAYVEIPFDRTMLNKADKWEITVVNNSSDTNPILFLITTADGLYIEEFNVNSGGTVTIQNNRLDFIYGQGILEDNGSVRMHMIQYQNITGADINFDITLKLYTE